MTQLTKPMLRMLLDLHDAPHGALPESSVALVTARALVHRDYARWVDAGDMRSLVLSPRGRRVVSRAMSCGLRGAA